jgi:hypothetical protein
MVNRIVGVPSFFSMPTSGLPAGLAAAILATGGGGIENAIDLTIQQTSPSLSRIAVAPLAARRIARNGPSHECGDDQ